MILFSTLYHRYQAPVDEFGTSGAAAPSPAAPAQAIDMRRSTQQISNSFVAEGSAKDTYIPKLVLFILYLFDNNRQYINGDFIDDMIAEDETDMENHNANMAAPRRPRSKAVINKRTQLRNYIGRAIINTPPSQGQNQTHSSPIKIDGDGAINIDVLKEYMQTNVNDVWVDRANAEEYIKASGEKRTITDDMVNAEGKVRCSVYQSKYQYGGIRSAFSYLYKLARVAMPEPMRKEMSTYLAGLERTILAAKTTLGLKLTEGKKPLSFEAFSLIARTMFESESKEDIFAHLFLLLDWNLMKRAENCINAKISNITVRSDSLVFEFAKSKGHQKGEEHVGPWHVYSNPDKEEPWLDIALAFARYLFCYPDVLKGEAPLFTGSTKTVYRRYADRFTKVVKDLKIPLHKMGYTAGDLGTHSARKGVGTMVAAGCTVSPPIVSLCIRAGWVLGGVKDKYLFRENAGDQYVGRCASGLDQNEIEFASSPAYFDYTHLDDNERVVKKRLVQDFIHSRLGLGEGATTITKSAYAIVDMCFAAVCYHYDDLKDKWLHQNCMLRQTSLFRGIPREITELVVVKFPWNKTKDTPKFTGIPPHVLHMSKIEELRLELVEVRADLKSLKDDLMTEFRKEMNSRGFGTADFNMERMIEMMAEQAETNMEKMTKKTESLLAKFLEETNVAQTATTEAAATSAKEYQDFAMIVEDPEDDAAPPPNNATVEETHLAEQRMREKSRQFLANRGFKAGLVKSKKRNKKGTVIATSAWCVLPATFTFPKMNPAQFIENWFISDVASNIPAYCTLDAGMVRHIKGGSDILRKMKRFMRFTERLGRRNRCWGEGRCAFTPTGWNLPAVQALWSGIKKDFNKQYLKKSKRPFEQSWSTAQNQMKTASLT